MKNKKLRLILIGALPIIALLLYKNIDYWQPVSPDTIKQSTFARLNEALGQKKRQSIQYLDSRKQTGLSLGKNQTIIDYYKTLNHLFRNNSYTNQHAKETEYALQEFFAYNLDKFYDMLFIDKQGDIFFTVKKENDYHKNINDAQFAGLSLQTHAKTARTFTFIDFEYYAASKEPASFYLIPVFDDDEFLGQIVLQLPINSINDIFINRDNLGETGEVYLVNADQLMLTDSRFIDTSTVLRKRIDTKAISNVKTKQHGNQIIKDYRDKWVFSRHESFRYEGAEWIIIAEIDEDEVLTDYYRHHEAELYPLINQFFLERREQTSSRPPLPEIQHLHKVDVKEFLKAKDGTGLYTKGVGTCTAVAIYMPKQFAYLAHITPTDSIYNDNWFHKNVLGKQYTDYVDTMLRRIKLYDILPYQLSDLKFSIAAPNRNGLRGAINKLVNNGIWLSQITIHYLPNYSSVDLVVDYRQDRITSIWKQEGVIQQVRLNRSEPSIMEIIKTQIGYKNS